MTTVEEEVETLLRKLAPHEEHILRLRFGIGDAAHDFDDMAVWLSLGATAVRRIERSAHRKLRLAALMDARGERACTG